MNPVYSLRFSWNLDPAVETHWLSAIHPGEETLYLHLGRAPIFGAVRVWKVTNALVRLPVLGEQFAALARSLQAEVG